MQGRFYRAPFKFFSGCRLNGGLYDDIDFEFDNLGGKYLSGIANTLVGAITNFITKDKDKLLVDNVKKMIDKNFDTLIC